MGRLEKKLGETQRNNLAKKSVDFSALFFRIYSSASGLFSIAALT